MSKEISFVIPAYNEQEYLPICIKSINRFFSTDDCEIIIIDNGSTDNTVSLAEELGASVYQKTIGTIASLRNFGVTKATGKIIIFLDADIELTDQWIDTFKNEQPRITKERLILGSQAAVPSRPSFIEKFWFDEFYKRQDITHLGSAHLILSKETFDLISGFDEDLETGEDYDFCVRAKSKDVALENNLELKVIHYGFPKSVTAFVKREIWHGKGDAMSLRSIIKSKVAIASAFYIFCHLILLTGLLLGSGMIIIAAVVFLLLLLFASIQSKFSHSQLTAKVANFTIFYIYYFGRSISLIKGLFLKS